MIRNRARACKCPPPLGCSCHGSSPPRLAGYLDSGGTYQTGTNPDPTYGGTVPAPDLYNPSTPVTWTGYDANGNWIGVTTDPATGKVTTAAAPTKTSSSSSIFPSWLHPESKWWIWAPPAIALLWLLPEITRGRRR